jgi:hypothetical protein
VTVQSALVQQPAFAMQLFDAVQTFWLAAQPQVPAGAEQVWPVTVQSAVVQQVALAMQLFEAVQAF